MYLFNVSVYWQELKRNIRLNSNKSGERVPFACYCYCDYLFGNHILMINYATISVGLIVMGSIFLIFATYSSIHLISQLPNDGFRRGWRLLSCLIVIFVLLFWSIALLIVKEFQNDVVILFASIVLLLTTIFVFFVSYISSQSLGSLKRIDTLEREIVKDELMGIYNRRYFMSRLKEEYERYKRYQLPFSLLLLDIDHFKKVNDTYGHIVGDKFLVRLAMLISTNLRPSDIFARYGGEEMAILLPNTWQTDAKNVADKLRVIIEEKNIDIDLSNEVETLFLNCTVSIGVSTSSKDLKKGNDIVRQADEALYLAKDEGRNKVVIYDNN